MLENIAIIAAFCITQFIIISALHLGIGRMEKYGLWLFAPVVIGMISLWLGFLLWKEDFAQIVMSKTMVAVLTLSLYSFYAGAVLFMAGCVKTVWTKRKSLYTKKSLQRMTDRCR